MGRIAMVLAAVVMMACASSSVKMRRPLITDKTPLGTKAVLVARWFAANGWCIDEREGDRVWARLCDQNEPLVLAVLSFRDGVLVQADVRVPVGRSQAGAPMPIPSAGRPTPQPSAAGRPGPQPLYARTRDNANELLDALGYDLESRYGTPLDRAGEPALTWVTDRERITLYLERNRRWIVERHMRAADPEAQFRPWLTEGQ